MMDTPRFNLSPNLAEGAAIGSEQSGQSQQVCSRFFPITPPLQKFNEHSVKGLDEKSTSQLVDAGSHFPFLSMHQILAVIKEGVDMDEQRQGCIVPKFDLV